MKRLGLLGHRRRRSRGKLRATPRCLPSDNAFHPVRPTPPAEPAEQPADVIEPDCAVVGSNPFHSTHKPNSLNATFGSGSRRRRRLVELRVRPRFVHDEQTWGGRSHDQRLDLGPLGGTVALAPRSPISDEGAQLSELGANLRFCALASHPVELVSNVTHIS
jgi:hypothetical protein